jgi:hypothetical protein
MGSSLQPTNTDIGNQTYLQSLQTQMQGLQDKRLKTKWYGTDAAAKADTTAEEVSNPGMISKTLDFLSRPLYGVVGGVKHFTGESTGSLYQDVAKNMVKEKSTFGDVLSSKNVPWGVSAPLGFALDIMFDPVNWATMGTGALIPKIATGAYKGFKTGETVLGGIKTASKAGMLEKAVTVGKYLPFVKKTEAFSTLGKKAIESTSAWEKLSGITAESIVANKNADMLGIFRKTSKGLFDKAVESSPKAQRFLEHFIYDPTEWVKQARVKDILQQTLGKDANIKGAVNAFAEGKTIEPFLGEMEQQMREIQKNVPVGSSSFLKDFDINNEIANSFPNQAETDAFIGGLRNEGADSIFTSNANHLVKDADDAVSVANDLKGTFVSSDPFENASRLSNDNLMQKAIEKSNEMTGGGITLDYLSKIVNSGAVNDTGVKWFDKMMKGVKEYTIKIDRAGTEKTLNVGKKTLETYDKGMALFRVAKVAASPSSWVNAVAGNLIMTHMAGGSIGPKFLKRLEESRELYYTKNPKIGAKFDDLLMKAGGSFIKDGGVVGPDEIRRGLGEFKTAVRSSLGEINYIGDKSLGKKGLQEYVSAELSMKGRDIGVLSGELSNDELVSAMADVKMELENKISSAHMDAISKNADILSNKSSASNSRKAISDAGGVENVNKYDIGTGLVSQEMYSSNAASEMFTYIADRAAKDPENKTFKILDFIYNKMPEGYEKVDQSFKMATFMTATVDGYSINELRRISKIVDIDPSSIRKVIDKGETRYALSTKNALELGNVMYLNYAAMPSAVKVLRNLPLVGSPFISFMYGMTIKTGQTLATNPAAFNKVGFAMSEVGGQQTPLEKKSLSGPFYSYLNQQGMMRIPFFEQNPVYVNMASMIPYYSLNMFNPTKTTYGGSIRNQLAQTLQDSPLMKDPLGSTLFDYFIQPLILDEATRPQGQFGQPLYPIDATLLEKTGYGARSLSEAVFPNILQYTGLLPGSEKIADYVPSYRWRQLSAAKEGKNQLGISSKEPEVQKTARVVASSLGIPIQTPVNTSFASKK